MKHPRVLVIDDEEEFVSTLVERLEFRGIPAKGVTTGGEGLACLKNESFDVVVVDLKMPRVDGLQIRKMVEENYPRVRVILVTGHGGQSHENDFEPEGKTVLMKPFALEELLELIKEEKPIQEAKSG